MNSTGIGMGLLAALSAWAVADCGAVYIEDWNTPENGANNWMMYKLMDGVPVNAAMDYGFSPPGTGWVRADLSAADTSFANTAFVLYTLDPATPDQGLFTPREASQNINLNVSSQVSVDIRLQFDIDLDGGVFRFFIGEWLPGEGSEPDRSAFWVFEQPFAHAQDAWASSSIDVSSGNWIELDYSGYAPGEVTPQDLFDNPQQYGVTIHGLAGGSLNGVANFDNFSAIPEPGSGSLLLAAAVLLWAIRAGRGRAA
jgi:hypothetical protein